MWRLLAVGSSLFARGLPRMGKGDVLPVVLLLLVIIVPQAYAGYATEVARETADEVFVEPSPSAILPSQEPEPDPSNLIPAEPSPSGLPSASPSPTPVPVDPRITGVIVGVDAGVGRRTYGTDTMIVVSMDPATETVSMVSVPRDMVDVPLADGRTYRGKINGLVSYVRNHPKQFPKNDGTGFDVLMGALGKLLGVKIDYYAAVTLQGFVKVVNTLGGVDVNVARAFCDPRYLEYGFTRGFSITAGKHHLNGNQALAYARVRKAAGESDFTRAARQQEVLSGIRDRVVKGGFVNDPIGLLRALSKTVTTNVPRKIAPRPRRRGHEDRPGRDLPGGHQPPAGRLRERHARLDPDPEPQEDPGARRGPLPDRRLAAQEDLRRPEGQHEGGQRERRERLRPRGPEGDAEADPEAHEEAHAEADGGPDADAVAARRAVPERRAAAAIGGRSSASAMPPSVAATPM